MDDAALPCGTVEPQLREEVEIPTPPTLPKLGGATVATSTEQEVNTTMGESTTKTTDLGLQTVAPTPEQVEWLGADLPDPGTHESDEVAVDMEDTEPTVDPNMVNPEV